MYNFMSSARSEVYFFLSNLDAFSFSCLIAVARTANTMLNRSGESGYPCLVPDFRAKAFGFSLLSMMLAVGFIMLRTPYLENTH